MRFYEKVKLLRKKRDMSQQQLAEKLGIHTTHLSRIENGHLSPSFDMFKKLIDIFEVSADYLLNEGIDDFDIKIKDKGLAERIRLIDLIEENDRKALIQIIDALLTKQKMRDLLHEPVNG